MPESGTKREARSWGILSNGGDFLREKAVRKGQTLSKADNAQNGAFGGGASHGYSAHPGELSLTEAL
jgi:hypothetical protein